MANNISLSDESFSQTNMKPESGEEAVAIWASKVAANTGFNAQLPINIMSGDSHARRISTEEYTYRSTHRGYYDGIRRYGTLEIRIGQQDVSSFTVVFHLNTTQIWSETYSGGSHLVLTSSNADASLDLEDYASGGGAVTGSLAVQLGDSGYVHSSFDLYASP